MENEENMEENETCDEQFEVQFQRETGETPFSAFSVPKNVSNDKLKLLLKAFHEAEKSSNKKKIQDDNEDDDEDFMDVPYLFFINGHEIQTTIEECIKYQILNTEKTVPIVYQPQAVFK